MKEMLSSVLEGIVSKVSKVSVLLIKTSSFFFFYSPTQVALRLQRLQARGFTPRSSPFPIVPYL